LQVEQAAGGVRLERSRLAEPFAIGEKSGLGANGRVRHDDEALRAAAVRRSGPGALP
jgi:hypothetical protein